ncbi:MAG: MarR family winged helix-turn-helix transcriptional regulator [Thermovirgaceae bacterium]|nr:MarR family winged helix-turn-helix transcriptional regulator [Thermovirgaceae bacterium]
MDESFGKWLSIIHRNLCSFMDNAFPGSDIGHGPRRFLVEIALFPGHTQEEISERLLMDKTTTARAVKQLEQRGYINRKRDPYDRRRYRLIPTQKGEEMLPLVLEARRKAHIALSHGFSEEDLAQTASILRRMADNAVRLRTEIGESNH